MEMKKKTDKNNLTQKRLKPTVAYENERAATNNFDEKLKTLKNFINEIQAKRKDNISIGSLKDAYPDSIRQFNLWDSEKGPNYLLLKSGEVSRNSHATLLRYPDYLEKIKTAISCLSELEIEIANPRRAESKLKSKILYSEKLRKILEEEVIGLRNEVISLKEKIHSLEVKNLSLKRELKGYLEKEMVQPTDKKKSHKGSVTKIRYELDG